jgi:hypothetical protein
MATKNRPPFYEIAEQLRRLAEIQVPSPDELATVVELIGDEAYARYFFHVLGNLENAGWIDPLDSSGVFGRPPDPVPVGDGTYQVPVWPASQYLAVVAGERPSLVLPIARRIRTDNPRVISDFLYAARQMPPSHAAGIVATLDEWLETPFSNMFSGDIGDLMSHLAEGGEWEAALELVEIATRPVLAPVAHDEVASRSRYVEVQPRCDAWYFDNLVRGPVRSLGDVKPLALLRVLVTQLRRAIELELDARDAPTLSDGSLGWRAAIEDHEQNRSRSDFKNVIVAGIRDLADEMAARQPQVIRGIAAAWLDDHYSIFRRLAIHVVRLHPDSFPDLLVQLLGKRPNLDDSLIHHEFYLLMESASAKAPESVRQRLLEWITEGEPPEELERSRQHYRDRMGGEASEELVRMWNDHWILTRLWALRHQDLPFRTRSILERLVAEMGEPDHPDFLVYMTIGYGPATPVNAAELERMSVTKVVEYLANWTPPDDPSSMLSYEGLGRALERAVKSKPRTYSWVTSRFLEPGPLRERYLGHLLWGLHEAWVSGRHISWRPIFQACDMIVEWRDRSHDEARRRVVDLLGAALREPDRYLPRIHMKRARDLLLVAVTDPDPRPEDELKWLASNPDPLTLAINSVRGKALEALVDYAKRHKELWRDEARTYRRYSPSLGLVDTRVLDALDERLVTDRSLAVRSIFGERFLVLYWLDKDWTRARIDQLFLPHAFDVQLWQATWDAYVAFNKVWKEVYELLRPQYRVAIKQLGLRTGEGQPPSRSADSLAQHLMIAYWVGLEKLQDKDGLLEFFYEQAPGEARSHATWIIWRLLAEQKPAADSKEWRRAKHLWRARTAAAQRADDQTQFAHELLGFLRWLDSVPDSLGALYSLIKACIPYYEFSRGPGRALPAFLASESADYPLEACQLLSQLLEGGEESVRALLRPQETWTVLERAISSPDPDSVSCAVDAVNRLGELGLWDYEDLLSTLD